MPNNVQISNVWVDSQVLPQSQMKVILTAEKGASTPWDAELFFVDSNGVETFVDNVTCTTRIAEKFMTAPAQPANYRVRAKSKNNKDSDEFEVVAVRSTLGPSGLGFIPITAMETEVIAEGPVIQFHGLTTRQCTVLLAMQISHCNTSAYTVDIAFGFAWAGHVTGAGAFGDALSILQFAALNMSPARSAISFDPMSRVLSTTIDLPVHPKDFLNWNLLIQCNPARLGSGTPPTPTAVAVLPY